jgi:hypothetical protein
MVRTLPSALALTAALAAGAATAAPPDATTLAIENRRLANRLALAESGGFYLVLDLGSRRLDLMLQGVVLRGHPVESMEIGRPSLLFATRSAPEGWSERTWAKGRLVPPRPDERLEVRANDGTEEPPEIPEIPPTPEERYPAPDRFEIRYEGGLTLEVVRADDPGRGILRRARDAIRAMASLGAAETRVRVVLAPADHAALWRSLPDDTSFTVS